MLCFTPCSGIVESVTNRAVAKHAEGGVVPDVPLAVAVFSLLVSVRAPVLPLAHAMAHGRFGIEPFVWPTHEQWGLLWINAGLGIVRISFARH